MKQPLCAKHNNLEQIAEKQEVLFKKTQCLRLHKQNSGKDHKNGFT